MIFSPNLPKLGPLGAPPELCCFFPAPWMRPIRRSGAPLGRPGGKWPAMAGDASWPWRGNTMEIDGSSPIKRIKGLIGNVEGNKITLRQLDIKGQNGDKYMTILRFQWRATTFARRILTALPHRSSGSCLQHLYKRYHHLRCTKRILPLPLNRNLWNVHVYI